MMAIRMPIRSPQRKMSSSQCVVEMALRSTHDADSQPVDDNCREAEREKTMVVKDFRCNPTNQQAHPVRHT